MEDFNRRFARLDPVITSYSIHYTKLYDGVVLGSAGDGRISSAARADYAAAAAAVLLADDQAGKVYELAGDEAYTLTVV